MKRLASVLVLACALALTACSTDPSSAVGRWGSTIGEDGSYVELHLGGQLSGHDGCNGFGGRWSEPSLGHARFDEVATTLIACVGVGFGEQWLSRTSTAELKGGRLFFYDRDGKELGSLSRAA